MDRHIIGRRGGKRSKPDKNWDSPWLRRLTLQFILAIGVLRVCACLRVLYSILIPSRLLPLQHVLNP